VTRPIAVATPTRPAPALLGLVGVAVAVGLLEALPRLGLVDRRYLPPFNSMAEAIVSAR